MTEEMFLARAKKSIKTASEICRIEKGYVRGVISGLHSAALMFGFESAAEELMDTFEEACK